MFDDIEESFSDMFDQVIDFVPKLALALLLLLAGKFIAGIARRLAHKLLTALKFDAAVDRSGLGAHVERAGFADSGLLVARIVGWMIMLLVIKTAVEILGIDSIETLVDDLVSWIPHVIVAIVLIVITGAVASFVGDLLDDVLDDFTMGDLLHKVIVAGIWVLGGMLAINELGFGEDIINQLWTALTTGLAAIIVIKFGIGGIWAARDRFWPAVYDAIDEAKKDNKV